MQVQWEPRRELAELFWKVGVGFIEEPIFEVCFGQRIEVCEMKEGCLGNAVWCSLSLTVVDMWKFVEP